MKTRTGAIWTKVGVGDLLHGNAQGGTATIHRITEPVSLSRYVLKLFATDQLALRRKPEHHEKLDTIARFAMAKAAEQRPFVTWPLALAYAKQNGGAADLVGFVMMHVPNGMELDYLFAPHLRAKYFPGVGPDQLLAVGADIADRLARLHASLSDPTKPGGIVFGDLTPRNILVTTQGLQVRFIDADSFQFTGTGKILATKDSTEGFRARVIADAFRSKKPMPAFTTATDAECLAIILFKLLVNDAHPWASSMAFEINGETPSEEENMLAYRFPYKEPAKYRPPQLSLNTYNALPGPVRAAFEQAFLTARPPTPAEWAKTLGHVRASFR
jgi:DNA-binding helix-hairpin-helix protein with protein kinase domain